MPDDSFASGPANAGGDEPLTLNRYDTGSLPPEKRLEGWQMKVWPRAEPVFRTTPTEPFDTRGVWVLLGPVMFLHAEITAMKWERRMDDIRTSDFDPIVINIMKRGAAHGDFDGRPFLEPQGSFHFHDLARPSRHVSTGSETYSLIFPRPLAEQWFGSLETLHGLVVPQAEAAMVLMQAEQTARLLPTLTVSQAERLARVFGELVAVALTAVRPGVTAKTRPQDALRRRAGELIEMRLGSSEVEAEDLCRALAVSRGRLFAAFKSAGGVRAYVMSRRLERAREALAELSREEAVGVIAHRLGFSDAAHFSRAFRQRYGVTPSAYRRLILSDARVAS